MSRIQTNVEKKRWTRRHPLHEATSRALGWLVRRRLLKQCPGEVFQVRIHALKLPTLPANFPPLRIVHVSDWHVGHLFTPDHLPAVVEAINSLDADLIALTGDFLDYTNRHLTRVIEAVRELRAPLGVYSVLGNHDYMDNGPEVIHAFRMADLNLLLNEHVIIDHGKHQVAVAGIDWANDDANLARLIDHTCDPIHGDEIRILLAHHPHALDAAAQHGVHLVLSGHTHGGQVLFRPGKTNGRKSLGLGNVTFRYPQGHYARGNTHLFVTTGLGSAVPVRIRCPAEISVLEVGHG